MNKIIHDCIDQLFELQNQVEHYAIPTPPLDVGYTAWVADVTGEILQIQVISESINPHTDDRFYMYAPVDMSRILLYLDQQYTKLYKWLPGSVRSRFPKPYTYNMVVDEYSVFNSQLECQVFSSLTEIQNQLLELDFRLSEYGFDAEIESPPEPESDMFEIDPTTDTETVDMQNPEPHFDKPGIDYTVPTPRVLSDEEMREFRDRVEQSTKDIPRPGLRPLPTGLSPSPYIDMETQIKNMQVQINDLESKLESVQNQLDKLTKSTSQVAEWTITGGPTFG